VSRHKGRTFRPYPQLNRTSGQGYVMYMFLSRKYSEARQIRCTRCIRQAPCWYGLFLFRLFPVSPISCFAYFLFHLFPVSPISSFAYFLIVCSNPHARSRLDLPVWNNSAEVSGTGNRTWYEVCEFVRVRGVVSP
jgi:hypothetical protein